MVWSGWGGAVYSGFCAGKIGDDEMGPGGGGWVLNNFYVLIEDYQEILIMVSKYLECKQTTIRV